MVELLKLASIIPSVIVLIFLIANYLRLKEELARVERRQDALKRKMERSKNEKYRSHEL